MPILSKRSGGRPSIRLSWAILLAILALAKAAKADCSTGETEIFACSFHAGRKAVSLCTTPERITYRYGPPGTEPELVMARGYTEVSVQPWNGIGRAIWESVSFANAGHRYELGMSLDKIDAVDGRPATGGSILIRRDGDTLADLTCDAGSARYQGFALQDAYRDAGYCWDYAAGSWRRNCE